MRRRLPNRRRQWTQRATIAGETIHLSVGEYDDGTPGEVFINTAISTDELLRAMLSSLAIAVSVGLQHGASLETFVRLFARSSFGPCGPVVGSDQVRLCSSILDWVFREMEAHYAASTSE